MFKRIQNFAAAMFLVAASLAPALVVPGVAHATSCDQAGGAGGSNGSQTIAQGADSGPIDSSATKVGVQITPVVAWQSSAPGLLSRVYLANTDCSPANAAVTIILDATGNLSVTVVDGNHTGSYVQGSDFANGAAGVTWSSDIDTAATINYAIGALPLNTAQLVSVDLGTDPGYADIMLKQGSGTDTLLGSMKLTSGITKFSDVDGAGVVIEISGGDSSWDACSSVTAGYETQAQILIDGAVIDSTLGSKSTDQCPHLDLSSYDSNSKTLDFKYQSVAQSGLSADAGVTLPSTPPSSQFDLPFTSLNVSGGNFTDSFISTNSASQQLYFLSTFNADAQGYADNDQVPVAGGVFDMSNGSNLDASGVLLDTSLTAHSAVAHNFASLTKDKTFTLFVPYKSGDKAVGLCPGAANLSAVSTSCSGIYYLTNGQSKTHSDTSSIPAGVTVTANIVTVNGSQYWQVSGLTGTGGFSSASGPSTPNTGFGLVSAHASTVAVASIMAAILLIFTANKLQPASKRR